MKNFLFIMFIIAGLFLASCEHNVNGPAIGGSSLSIKIKEGRAPDFNSVLTKLVPPQQNRIKIDPYKMLKGTNYNELKIIVLDLTRWKTYQEFNDYWDATDQGSLINYHDIDTTKDLMDIMTVLLKKYTGDAYEYIGDFSFSLADSVTKGAFYVNPGLNTCLYAFRENGVTDIYSIDEAYFYAADSGTTINIYSGGSSLPEIPVLSLPADNEIITSTSTYFSWYSSGAETYNLQISTTSTFQTMVINQTGTLSYYITNNLVRNQRYFWRVRASNASGSSSWSTVFSFLVQ